jgi:hypothetical protein
MSNVIIYDTYNVNVTIENDEVIGVQVVEGFIHDVIAGTNITIDKTDPLNPVISSSGGNLTNGNGTTANGTAVDLGGNLTEDTLIGGAYTLRLGQIGNVLTYLGVEAVQILLQATQGNPDFNSGYISLGLSSSFKNGNNGFEVGVGGPSIVVGSDATGDQYHRNASGYLVRRGTVSAASTSSLTINSDTTYQYSLTALAAALSIEAPTGTPFNGQDLLIRIKDNATARALTWNAIFRVIGVTLPTTTVISKTMYIACIYNSTDTKWDVIGVREQA